MTGKIKTLSTGLRNGCIETDDRATYQFDWSQVLAYDVAFLKAGHPVTFDLRTNGQAFNVSLYHVPRPSPAPNKNSDSSLRYIGFEQANGLRLQRFEYGGREDVRIFTVQMDLGIFAKLRLTIQEGPAICLDFLNGVIHANPAALLDQTLSEDYLQAFVGRRPVPDNAARLAMFRVPSNNRWRLLM